MMKRILCPTDFSPSATNAIAYAAKFCQVVNAEMTLFNVQSIFDLSPAEIIEGESARIRSVAQLLEEQSDEVGAVFKIVSHADIQPAMSPLSHAIEEKASDYDLIIMGGGKPHDLYSFFAGSNAYNATKRCNIPVMLIPDSYLYTSIDQIVYAYNVLKERRIPLHQLTPWLDKLNATLCVLEVLEKTVSLDVEDEMKEIQQLLEQLYPEIPMTLESVYADSEATGIHRYMESRSGGLLVMCSKQRNLISSIFHKSAIKGIYDVACYPTLVVHD